MFKKVLSILLFNIFFLGTSVLCFAFTNTDFSGHWVFKGRWASGTITADDHGNITGGSMVVESGDPVSVSGSYMLNTDGSFTIHLTAVGKGDLEGQGAMNLNKDIVIFTEYDETQNEFYLNNLIKISESSFTNNDFSGSWIWKGRWAVGKLTADDNGNIIEGSAIDEYGNPISFTGSYLLNNDGTFSIQVTAPGKGTLEGQGAMNLSKDIVTFAEYNASYSEFYLNYFLKRKNGKTQPWIPLLLLDD